MVRVILLKVQIPLCKPHNSCGLSQGVRESVSVSDKIFQSYVRQRFNVREGMLCGRFRRG